MLIEINEIEQTITIGELRSTLALVSWWNSAFDAKFMDFLYEETVSYQYSSTELIFTKENSDKELVFVAIEWYSCVLILISNTLYLSKRN